VFGALTTAEEVTQWWGSPETYKTEAWAADLRVGGLWKAEGRGADGKPFSLSGTILELDPTHKLVQTWTADWDGGHETKVTYRLQAISFGYGRGLAACLLTRVVERLSAGRRDAYSPLRSRLPRCAMGFAPKVRFAVDSPLEGRVHCELVSEIRRRFR
jgi:uncharacterized protein YndB with AHSA1/START domain